VSGTISNWICLQLGARQHYANPRTLHKAGILFALITDAWLTPETLPRIVTGNASDSWLRRLSERYHPELKTARIFSFTSSLIQFELAQSYKGHASWKRMIARNEWFQRKALRIMEKLAPELSNLERRPTLLSFSYAARDVFRYAKSQGWVTVLEQIDPGPVEENLVAEEHTRRALISSSWRRAPNEYWKNWHEECELADWILVNSRWTSEALRQVGVPPEKMSITPLTFDAPDSTQSFVRQYPQEFTKERPLRVLFLGTIGLRKGAAMLLEAAELLCDSPIEYWLVGPCELDRSLLSRLPNIRFLGPVGRGRTSHYYRDADVFVFPTLSDGFGLTQLEAQAWRLPIIASRFCGDVVIDGVNGFMLGEVSGKAIAEVVVRCAKNPSTLQRFADAIPLKPRKDLEPLLTFLNAQHL
jgi:glycosyltransferase involved in cell wall biosynthesis